VHHLVHVRAARQVPRLPFKVRLRQRHYEHDRFSRHHTLLYHPCHHRGGEGGGDSAEGPRGAEQGGQQPGHVVGHTSGDPISASVSNLQTVATFEGSANSRADPEGLNERTWSLNVFPLYR